MKRAFALIVVAVICLLGGAPTAAAPKLQPKGPTVEEVRRTLFATSWFETGKVVAGKNDPDGPLGWKFGAEEVENWQITGELVTDRMFGGAKIDVAGDLWRLDIYSKNDKGRVSVLPTIFKFEGKTLVWVTEFPGEGWYSEIARNGEYNGRPTSFESTAKNRYAVRRFKPCDYLQTTEPE